MRGLMKVVLIVGVVVTLLVGAAVAAAVALVGSQMGAAIVIGTLFGRPPDPWVILGPREDGIQVVKFTSRPQPDVPIQASFEAYRRDMQDLEGGEVVAFVQREAPTAAALATLDLKRPFKVGEHVEGVGTVVVASALPVKLGAQDEPTPPLHLPPGESYLSVLARGAEVNGTVGAGMQRMRAACDCDVIVEVEYTELERPGRAPTEPGQEDAGDKADVALTDEEQGGEAP